jgi:HK97 family phage prohead protease
MNEKVLSTMDSKQLIDFHTYQHALAKSYGINEKLIEDHSNVVKSLEQLNLAHHVLDDLDKETIKKLPSNYKTVKSEIPLSFPLEVIKVDNGEGEEGNWYIEGYISTDDPDLENDIITIEAMKDALKNLDDNKTILYMHDTSYPIGSIVDKKVDKEGLWVKVLISKTVPEIWQKIKEGVLNKFSIRARVLEFTEKFDSTINKVLRVITKMYIIEASLVSVGANPKARSLKWYVSKALEIHENTAVTQDLILKVFGGSLPDKAEINEFLEVQKELNKEAEVMTKSGTLIENEEVNKSVDAEGTPPVENQVDESKAEEVTKSAEIETGEEKSAGNPSNEPEGEEVKKEMDAEMQSAENPEINQTKEELDASKSLEDKIIDILSSEGFIGALVDRITYLPGFAESLAQKVFEAMLSSEAAKSLDNKTVVDKDEVSKSIEGSAEKDAAETKQEKEEITKSETPDEGDIAKSTPEANVATEEEIRKGLILDKTVVKVDTPKTVQEIIKSDEFKGIDPETKLRLLLEAQAKK